MRGQCRDSNQGRFSQNFRIFKVVWFNNFSLSNPLFTYVISFSCSFNTLYEYISVKMFRFSFNTNFSDYTSFAENKPISAKVSNFDSCDFLTFLTLG